MASTEMTLTLRNIEIDFLIEGEVEFGGSNGYGSDEPAWAEVTDMIVYHNGKKVSDKVTALLTGKDWDAIETALMEDSGW